MRQRRALRRAIPVLVASTTLGLVVTTVPYAIGSSYTLNRRLEDSRIVESSGLARSTYARDILFTHNDSGDSARVFAVDPSGDTQAVLTLGGISSRDAEDSRRVAHTVVGRHRGQRRRPRRHPGLPLRRAGHLVEQDRLCDDVPVQVRQQAHNAEGLMVDPVSGRLYVVTKATSGAGIYVAPSTLSTSTVNTLTRVASAPSLIKAASFSPDGSRFVLSGGSYVYVYRSIGGTPVRIQKPPLQQGESVAVSRGGGTMVVGSEGNDSPVYEMSMP